ncbi:MAG: hypothetical protein K8S87_00130, partial [Planctomycetes bacterium]|nr:hypothetical protein [Planctomycetota bacterium]
TRSYDHIPEADREIAAKYYFNQGMYSLQRKNAVDAMPYFSEVIRISPKYADAYYQRARIYSAADLMEQSISDFETAKKLSKQYRLLDALKPLDFELSKSDIEIIKPVPVPSDAAIVAKKAKPLEK